MELNVRNNKFVFCYCMSGTAVSRVDLLPVEFSKGGIAVLVPGQLVQPQSVSADFEAIVLILSQKFVEEMGFPYDFQFAVKLRDNPVLADVSDNMRESVIDYFNAISRIMREMNGYVIPVIRHLTAAFGYTMVSYVEHINKDMMLDNNQKIMRCFMSKVKENFREHRKVSFYADALRLAPAYLSTVIKEASGQSPSYWIDSYVAENARGMLRSTGMTVNEISDALKFPSASFFGKFFKRVTGQSPTEFRNSNL